MGPGTLILTLALAALVGLALGTLGGGGSIRSVPLLTYVAGFAPKEAIASSLFVVGVTSIVSLAMHARAGRVRWRTGFIFGAAGMVGAFAGGLIGSRLPGTVLLIAFALMMVATSIAMIRRRPTQTETTTPTEHRIPIVKTIAEGLVVGVVTGIVGAGGGFLIVPALVLLGGLSMPVAVGTSLLVIAMKSFAGLAGYLTAVTLNWQVVAAVAAVMSIAAIAGAVLAGQVRASALQKGFGYFVLVVGLLMLGLQLAPALSGQ